MITIRQRYRQTERQTDGRTDDIHIAIGLRLRYAHVRASRGKNGGVSC